MYEKVVSYFERNLCIENIYFRRNYILWIVGIMVMVFLELIVNFLLYNLISDVLTKVIVVLIMDGLIALIILILIYVLPINKIYKEKVKSKTKFDILGWFMKEEVLGAYRKVECKKMDNFLKKECKIKNIESIETIINIINEEIKDKYTSKSFSEKYFNNTILPVLILILTVYFTNTNEQNLASIVTGTIISITSIIIVGNIITKIKNINITPVNKRNNLLELKNVLMDIKIKW